MTQTQTQNENNMCSKVGSFEKSEAKKLVSAHHTDYLWNLSTSTAQSMQTLWLSATNDCNFRQQIYTKVVLCIPNSGIQRTSQIATLHNFTVRLKKSLQICYWSSAFSKCILFYLLGPDIYAFVPFFRECTFWNMLEIAWNIIPLTFIINAKSETFFIFLCVIGTLSENKNKKCHEVITRSNGC